ncbi:MAG: hypothetical protein ACR2PF_06855 [Rhizobiaceae bacterium]
MNFRNRRGRLNIDTLKYPANRTLNDILYKLRAVRGRKIDSDVQHGDGFTLEGRDRNRTRFIVHIRKQQAEIRGVSIVYSRRGGRRLRRLARKIFGTVDLFPGNAGPGNQVALSGAQPARRLHHGRFSNRSRYNPRNAEALCRSDYDRLQQAARNVQVDYPKRREFAMGETVEVRWRSNGLAAPARSLRLTIDVPADAEIVGKDVHVESWKSTWNAERDFASLSLDRTNKRVVIWLGYDSMNQKHYPGQGSFTVRFTRAGSFKLGSQVYLGPSYSFTGRKVDCKPAVLTGYRRYLARVNPPPKRYTTSKTCHLRNTGGLAAPTVSITAPRAEARVGEAMTFRWSVKGRVDSNCKTPLYLVFAMPERTRFEGDGFIALAPDARAPFDLHYKNDRTRVFVPLHIGDVARKGSVKVKFYEVGAHEISWTVVEVPQWVPLPVVVSDYDGERSAVTGNSVGMLKVKVRTTKPQIVVQDRHTLGKPKRTIYSNNGAYALEIFKTFYRVTDLETGELVVQREGQRLDELWGDLRGDGKKTGTG